MCTLYIDNDDDNDDDDDDECKGQMLTCRYTPRPAFPPNASDVFAFPLYTYYMRSQSHPSYMKNIARIANAVQRHN